MRVTVQPAAMSAALAAAPAVVKRLTPAEVPPDRFKVPAFETPELVRLVKRWFTEAASRAALAITILEEPPERQTKVIPVEMVVKLGLFPLIPQPKITPVP